MERRLEVMEQIVTCSNCELVDQCESPVPFFGPAPSRIAVIGEAPGEQEDKQGRPFIGPAGKMIRDHLTEVGIDPESLMWINTVNCFPHGSPEIAHIEACAQNKRDQIELADPEYLLLLGKVALFGQRSDVEAKRLRGRAFMFDGRINFPTWHPAAALRNRNYERAMHEDLEVFAEIVNGLRTWISAIGNTCVVCNAWHVWCDEDGLTWCEGHAPKEWHEREAFLQQGYEQAKLRLNPPEPTQLAMGG